ncbi:MAG TPA: ABC transporter ATP-binding protein [Tissierellia bacterium]|nr:ABC transporter ATP-binding protein [Tissierellia bacterium]
MHYIEIRDVDFEYEKGKSVFQNLSLNIDKNETIALMGPNGSGKTTLGKLMAGILKPTKGQVNVFSRDTRGIPLHEIGLRIGYLFQNPEKQFFANTVYDELGFVMKIKGYDEEYIKEKVEEKLELFQLKGLVNHSPFLLSQGEKQRLAIAAVLMNEPEYLILDEPTTGLDKKRKDMLLNLLFMLKNQGIGMTIISHDRRFVERICSRFIYISRGEIQYDERA